MLTELVKRELITQEVQDQVLSQQHTLRQAQGRRGFNFWLGEPFSDKERKLFVARYIERGCYRR